jgi:hypothetical protein
MDVSIRRIAAGAALLAAPALIALGALGAAGASHAVSGPSISSPAQYAGVLAQNDVAQHGDG